MEILNELLKELAIGAPTGATEDELSAFEAETGLKIPENLRSLYAACDGIVLHAGQLKILSLTGVKEHIEGFKDFGIPQRWGYFPLTDNNDSSPFCVCCHAPMTGYVVKVSHDDTAAVKFRSLDSFLAALREFVGDDKWDLYDLPSDFEKSERSNADIKTGRELLSLAPDLEDVEQGDAFRFGMLLLSNEQIDEIIPLLEYDDEYVRSDANERLTRIDTPESRRALANAREALKRFVSESAEVLTKAGINATIVNEIQIRLDPGPVWLNMNVFYSNRNDPGATDFLIERSRYFLSRKK